MEVIIPVIIVLAIIAFVLGRTRDSWMAKRIGEEVSKADAEDPVVLLEKLQRLREAGALTDEEFEAQKARILGNR